MSFLYYVNSTVLRLHPLLSSNRLWPPMRNTPHNHYQRIRPTPLIIPCSCVRHYSLLFLLSFWNFLVHSKENGHGKFTLKPEMWRFRGGPQNLQIDFSVCLEDYFSWEHSASRSFPVPTTKLLVTTSSRVHWNYYISNMFLLLLHHCEKHIQSCAPPLNSEKTGNIKLEIRLESSSWTCILAM